MVTQRVSTSFREIIQRHVHVLSWRRHHRHTHLTHRAHMDVHSPGTDTPPVQVYTNIRTHTNNLLLPDEDTHVWSKPFKDTHGHRHRLKKRIYRYPQTHGGTSVHTCSENTKAHRDTWTLMDSSGTDTRPSETDRPTCTPVHLFKKYWWHLYCVLGFFWPGDPAVCNADIIPVGEGNKARCVNCAAC